MPYFVVATEQTVKKFRIVEAPNDEEAWDLVRSASQGCCANPCCEVIRTSSITDEEYWDSQEITESQFQKREIPAEWAGF